MMFSLQYGVALAANFGMATYGFCLPMSSVVLPQLQKPDNPHFVINEEEGSWFGKYCLRYLNERNA